MSRRPRFLKGCITSVLVAAGLLFLVQWMVQEPSRRADQAHERIHLGMNLLDIEPGMTGRHHCGYRVLVSGEWKDVSREAFASAIKDRRPEGPQATEVWLMFFGVANRCAFRVRGDGAGRAVDIGKPKGMG